MVSAFQSDVTGFGSGWLAGYNINDFNEYRKMRHGQDTAPLTTWPTEVHFEYGNAHEGYWNNEHLTTQLGLVLDLLEWRFPDAQFVLEFDHSSGHKKMADNALSVTKIRVKFGGTVPTVMRETTLTDDCVYPSATAGEAAIWQNPNAVTKYSLSAVTGWTKIDCRKRSGDVQSFYFKETDPPPYYALDTPPADYIGKAKGKKQILWERGVPVHILAYLTDKGNTPDDERLMANEGVEDELDAVILPGYSMGPEDRASRASLATLIECAIASKSMCKLLLCFADFANESSILQQVINGRGHILLFSPKCHPELAGVGIEYSWGMAKKRFRKINATEGSKCSAAVFRARVQSALDFVTPSNCQAFARRTRRYRSVYASVAAGELEIKSFSDVERMVKVHKTHRNILDQETAFLNEQERNNDQAINGDDYDDDLVAAELGLNDRF
jgi:hypothetical protein